METNINWSHPHALPILGHLSKKVWTHSSHSVSHTKENFSALNQPGGTLTSICKKWTSRVIGKGKDPYGLGWGSYVIVRGKNNIKVLVITAYRVCTQSTNLAGPNISMSQQHRHLSWTFRESGFSVDPKPWIQFIYDLQAWIEYMSSQGHSIILGINANEGYINQPAKFFPLSFTLHTPISPIGHDGTLVTLIRSCGLCDPLVIHHPDSLFQESTPGIEPPSYRVLQMTDPRVVGKI